MELETLGQNRCFGGEQGVYQHRSRVTGTTMRFSVFTPGTPGATHLPVVYFLSGLTCTEENFTTKAGAQRFAAQHGLCVVAPDTSPRGLELPGEHDHYDFGSGAGFYVDATRAPWSANYRMYSYVTDELPELVREHFPVDPRRQGILGHSMGGHGALVCALRNPEVFRSVSALAPIVAPSQCPWGRKAFRGYLGDDERAWLEYDATALVTRRGYERPILIDQGSADAFLAEQLRPEVFEAACAAKNVPLKLRMQEGYDHSYYFIASFIGEHLAFHAEALAAGG